jgi:ribosomal protein S15P/S13E
MPKNSDAKKQAFSDIENIKRKLEKIREHYEKNKQDKKSMRERDRIFTKLRKLEKYHKVA